MAGGLSVNTQVIASAAGPVVLLAMLVGRACFHPQRGLPFFVASKLPHLSRPWAGGRSSIGCTFTIKRPKLLQAIYFSLM
jgi:hypothetical protein